MNTPRTALLAYRTDKLGDDVQSLALAQPHLLGEPDLWMDRDELGDYAGAGPVPLVANGVFLCPDRSGRLAFPPPNVETVAMPCLRLGVPVVMVETPDLPFRLTALPPWLKAWSELSGLDLDPARHRGAEWEERRAEWRELVGQRLRGRLEG